VTDVPSEISNFFLAMQAGRSAAATMEKLFSDDAVYEEPFSGKPLTHKGRAAILAAMEGGWQQPLPDMHLSIERVEAKTDSIAVDWVCRSPALPGGAGRGRNTFVLKDGKIVSLKTTLTM
jgi:hypothetical protein